MEAPAWVQAIVMLALLGVLAALVGFLIRRRRERHAVAREEHRRALASLPERYRYPAPPFLWAYALGFLFLAFVAGYFELPYLVLAALPPVYLLWRRRQRHLEDVLRDVRHLPDPERQSRLEALKAVYGRGDVERLWERSTA